MDERGIPVEGTPGDLVVCEAAFSREYLAEILVH